MKTTINITPSRLFMQSPKYPEESKNQCENKNQQGDETVCSLRLRLFDC